MASTSPPSSPRPDDDDLDELMRDPTPEPNAAVGGADGVTDPDANSGDAVGGSASESNDALIGPVRNELAFARRAAAQSKLNLYQRGVLDELVKSPPLIRDILLFVQGCATENKIDEIIIAAPAYEVSDELSDNIKSVVIGVLLSVNLAAYKGDIPKKGVLKTLLQKKLHFPKNYDDDASIQNTIEAEVGEELIQMCSKVKKMIKESVDKKSRLYDFASKLVKDTKCSVTVPLCGKLALLRDVYLKHPGGRYWDSVDIRLAAIHSKANTDQVKLSNVFKNLIKKDKETYGSKTSDKFNETANSFQQGIDSSLATAD